MKSYKVKTPMLAVNAVQYLGQPDNKKDETFAGWPMRYDPLRKVTVVLVQTRNGGVPAFSGDWIVTDSKGDISVLSDSVFAAKHEGVVAAPVAPAVSVMPAVPAAPASNFAAQQKVAQQKAAQWTAEQAAKK